MRAVQLLDPYAPVEILCERHTERDPHPGSQEAFDIHARFPWHRQPHTRVMVEVALDEQLLRPLKAEVATYSLEEIVAEKLRAILQHAKALESRGWVRSRARDYYDLWRILGASPARFDVSNFEALLREKCATRNVAFSGPDSFFPEAMLTHVERTWAQWLEPLVPDLPSYERMVADLRPLIEGLLSNSSSIPGSDEFWLPNRLFKRAPTWPGDRPFVAGAPGMARGRRNTLRATLLLLPFRPASLPPRQDVEQRDRRDAAEAEQQVFRFDCQQHVQRYR